MYEWLAEIWQTVERIGGQKILNLNSEGASKEEISVVEKFLKINLPPSYSQFLRRWNGAAISGSFILSTDQIIELADEYGFRPISEKVEKIEPASTHFYAQKPAHFLIFRTFDLGEDVQCFDTSRGANGEYPVCKYDAENDLEKNLKVRFPSFKALMMSEILDVVSDGAVYEEFLDIGDEDEIEEIENYFSDWERQLEEMLEGRGADMSDRVFPDWSNWK